MDKKDLSIKLEKIKMFVMDVDGTLTDGKIYMGTRRELLKAFNIKDGLGIKLLMESGIICVIITGRKSKITLRRAKELGISEIHQGIDKKTDVLKKICKKYSISFEEIAYIGDDINDLEVMELAGVSFAPADCANQLVSHVDILLKAKGGEGAVREAVEAILVI